MTRLLLAATAMLSLSAGAADVTRVTRGNLAIEGIPEIPPELVQRLRRYQFSRSAQFAGWTADGRITISTRFGNTNQLHIVDRPMGARRQITFFDEPVNGGSWSPTGARKGITYVRDAGGNENYQLEYLDPASADPVRLTDGRGRAESGAWSPDGTKYAFQWTARTGVATDVYIDDPLDRRTPELVFEAPEVGWNAADWSPDGKSLLLIHYVSANESYLWTYDLATRGKREIEPSKAKAARGGLFSRDGKGGVHHLGPGQRVPDAALRRARERQGDAAHRPFEMGHRRDCAVARRALPRLRRQRGWCEPARRDGPRAALGPDPAAIAVRRDRLVRLRPGEQAPRLRHADADLAVGRLGLDARGRQSRTLDRKRDRPLDRSKLLAPTLVRFPTFDQSDGKPREVPAWVYKPAGPGPHPVLISIHGGPESQAQPIFSANVQQWAAEVGYAVIQPNVRGSSGYGKTYLALDNGMKREDSVRDIGALLDWIATQSDLDAKRVVVIGGSYGGYMTLASMTHYNDRLRGAVDIVGISNFVTFLESTRSTGATCDAPSTVTSATRRCGSTSRRSRRSTTRERSRSRCWSCRARTTRACR
jgi:dipeptidyl aminopeptidase/acylaminoacyl peptidase